MSYIDIFDKEDCLTDPLTDHACRMFNGSVIGANAIRRFAGEGFPHTIWLSIVFEFMFFYFALTHHEALKDWRPDRRDKLTERLVQLLISRSVEYVLDDPTGKLVGKYSENAAARIEQYGRCESILRIEENQRMERSAEGLLGKQVSRLAGEDNDTGFTMTTHIHIGESVEFLRIRDLPDLLAHCVEL